MADEVKMVPDEITLSEKILGFFKSTLGKILIFTGLFLGISWYVITSSNAVLFKGSIIQNGVTDPALQNTNQSAIQETQVIPVNASQPVASNITINPAALGIDLSAYTKPNAPTALTAVCAQDNSSVTLRWMPVTNVTPVTYELYIQKTNMKPGDVLPFMKKDLTTTLFTEFQPTRGQEYQWWLYAKAGTNMSEQAAGTNFTCGALRPSVTTILDPNIFDKKVDTTTSTGTTTNTGGTNNGNTAALCPPNTYPTTPGVTTNCATLPDFNTLKSPAEFTSACQLYKNILLTGLDISMDPNTVQEISKQANGTICSPQFFQESGTNTNTNTENNTTGTTTSNTSSQAGSQGTVAASTSTGTTVTNTATSTKTTTPPTLQTLSSKTTTPPTLQTLSSKDNTPPTLHPSAGPESASTGPEIWVYSIAAATSYLVTRRKKSRK